LQAEPIPPSQRTDRPVSPELERLILKCLSKEAKDRPQSAAHLAQALDWIPTDAWGEEEAKRWWAAHNRSGTESPQARQAPLYAESIVTNSTVPGV
jgi:eukaryotic-like serine/threonine-protein kinase